MPNRNGHEGVRDQAAWSNIPGKAQASELPALMRIEEIAIRCSHVPARRRAASASQHMLPRHELAVILTHGALGRPKSRIGKIGAGGPFPNVAEHLHQVGVIL